MGKKQYDWRITRIGKTGHPVGSVKAADADAAIKAAIEKYGVPDNEQGRLSAQRVDT
jgi:hypothetical protein